MSQQFSNASQKKAQQHVDSQREAIKGNTGSHRAWMSNEFEANQFNVVNRMQYEATTPEGKSITRCGQSILDNN